MTIVSYPVRAAADLANISYYLGPKGKGEEYLNGTKIIDHCPAQGVEAYLLDTGYLLIPGSNGLGDYLRFNLRLFRIGARKFDLSSETTVKGHSGTIWHQGFFAHAKIIYDWMGARRPKLIVGHSLGAASAQILSKSWSRTAIGFAAPRPRKASGRILRDELSLSVCRKDDIVCKLPGTFQRMGQTKMLAEKDAKGGLQHSMKCYIAALDNPAPGVSVPKIWTPKLRK